MTTSIPAKAKYWVQHKLELVHSNLYGPVTPATPSGNKLFFLLVDDLSCYMRLGRAPMLQGSSGERNHEIPGGRGSGSREEAPHIAHRSRWRVHSVHVRRLLRRARGPEAPHCAAHASTEQCGGKAQPDRDGVARSMMKAMSLPGWFQGEAVNTVVFILNCAPTQSIGARSV